MPTRRSSARSAGRRWPSPRLAGAGRGRSSRSSSPISSARRGAARGAARPRGRAGDLAPDHQRLRHELERHGGTGEKFIGPRLDARGGSSRPAPTGLSALQPVPSLRLKADRVGEPVALHDGLPIATAAGTRAARPLSPWMRRASRTALAQLLIPMPMLTPLVRTARPFAPARSRTMPSRTPRNRARSASVRSASSIPGIGLP